MRLAILSAFPQELSCTLRNLGARKVSGKHPFPVFSAQLRTCDILLIQTGMGPRNAEAALKYAIREDKPDLVLSIGFGGALYSGADIGDLVWPSRVFLIDNGITESIELSGAGKIAGTISGKIDIYEGSVLTLVRQKKKSEIGNELHKGLPFPVCDMETYPIAKSAYENGLPFFAVRSITDRADKEIPPALFGVADESGQYRFSRALMLLLRNPRLLPESVELARNSRLASGRLWHAVRCLIETI